MRPHQRLERHAAPIPIRQQILTGRQSKQPVGISSLKLVDRCRGRDPAARNGLRDSEQIARAMIDLRQEVPDIFLALLLIVNVGGRAIPPDDRSLCVKQRRGAAQVPRISFPDRKQAVLHFIRNAGLARAKPRLRRRPPIVGMDDPFPIRPAYCSILFAAGAGVIDAAIGARRPDQLRKAVGQKPKMFFACSQFLLGATLLLCSEGEKLGSSGQGVAKAVELTNARRRRGDRRAGEYILASSIPILASFARECGC